MHLLHNTLNLNITCSEAGSFLPRPSAAPGCDRGSPANGEQIESNMPGCQRSLQQQRPTTSETFPEYDDFFQAQTTTNDDDRAQRDPLPSLQFITTTQWGTGKANVRRNQCLDDLPKCINTNNNYVVSVHGSANYVGRNKGDAEATKHECYNNP